MSLALVLLLAATTPAPEWTLTSDAFEVDGRTHEGHAAGSVRAVNESFDVTADEGFVTYERRRGRAPIVTTLVLTGHVHARRIADGAEAAGGRATWDRSVARVELTETPTARRGDALVEGDRIVLSTRDDRIDVVKAIVSAPSERGDPARITADALTVTHGGERALFSGDVHVVDGTRDARSERLEARFARGAGDALRLVRAQFTQNVRLRDAALRSTSSSADYEAFTRLMTLTGTPRLTGPDGDLSGERIVYDGRTGRARTERAKVRLKEVRR